MSSYRELTPKENEAIQKNLQNFMPKLFSDYSTPLPQLLASPLKNTFFLSLIALPILYLNHKYNPDRFYYYLINVFVIGVVLFNIYGRHMKNQNIIESMKRLPEGATKMDYVSQTAVMSNRLGRSRGGLFLGAGLSGGMLGKRR